MMINTTYRDEIDRKIETKMKRQKRTRIDSKIDILI